MRQRSGRLLARAIGCVLLGLALLVAGEAGAQLGDVAAGGTTFTQKGCGNAAPCHGDSENPKHLRGASLKTLQRLNADPTVEHGGGAEPFENLSDQALRNLATYISSIESSSAQPFKVSGLVTASTVPLKDVLVVSRSSYLADPQNPSVAAEYEVKTSAGLAADLPEGTFEFIGLPPGDYRISTSNSEYSFSPSYSDVELTDVGVALMPNEPASAETHLTGVDFSGTPVDQGRAIHLEGNCDSCHGFLNGEVSQNPDNILRGARLSVLEQLKTQDHQAPTAQWGTLSYPDLKVLARYLSKLDSQEYTITGNLKDAANPPNNVTDNNIDVELVSTYLPQVAPEKSVGGVFSFSGLKPGDYDVVPSHPAYDFAPTDREVALNREGVWLDRSAPSPTMSGTLLDQVDLTGTVKAEFAEGKTLYEANCITCHTYDAHGDDPRIAQGNEPVKPMGNNVFWTKVLGAATGGGIPVVPICPPGQPSGCIPQQMVDVVTSLSSVETDQIAKYLSIMFPVPLTVEGRVEFPAFTNPPPMFGEDMSAIVGATLTLENDLFPETKTAISDENGYFRISGLTGGRKSLSLSKPGFSFSQIEFEWGSGGLSFQEPSASNPRVILLYPGAGFYSDGVFPKVGSQSAFPKTYFLGEFDIDTSDQGEGAQLYGEKCASCHGADPSLDEKHILFGARLSVLKSIRYYSLLTSVLLPTPPDWISPLSVTAHDEAAFRQNGLVLTIDQLQMLSAYLATKGTTYVVDGTVHPAYDNTDVAGLRVSFFSETGPGAVATTNANGNYAVAGLLPGDYVISLPDVRTKRPWLDVLLSNRILQVRPDGLGSQPNVSQFSDIDFWLPEKFVLARESKIKLDSLIDLIESQPSNEEAWDEQYCAGTPETEEVPFDPDDFFDAVDYDGFNLFVNSHEVFLAGPIAHNLEGTEIRVPVSWNRTATIHRGRYDAPNVEWTVTGGSTVLTLRYDPASGDLSYCGETGDRLVGLTDPDGVLRITTGSLDGVPVLYEATIDNGVYTPPAVPVPGLATWGLLLGAAALALAGRRRLRR